MNHLEACGHCPKETWYGTCVTYPDRSWVNRRGGCGMFPERDLPEAMKKRVGQQKQKHSDRSYSSKNDRSGRTKFRGVTE
jgi:hypothetical protein